MGRLRMKWRDAVLAAFLVLLAPAALGAQVHLGGQVNLGSETDFGIGARLTADMDDVAEGLGFIGSFDFFFPDGPRNYWELNGNFTYTIDLQGTDNAPYLGGGLTVGRVWNGFSDTVIGLNLLGGLKVPLNVLTLFFEIRGSVFKSSTNQAVFSAGVVVP